MIVDLPQILECHSVTGDFDYVIKVAARNLKSLSSFLMEKLMSLPGVNSVRSSICLDELKCTMALPLPERRGGGAGCRRTKRPRRLCMAMSLQGRSSTACAVRSAEFRLA